MENGVGRPENNHKSRQQDQSRTLAESSLFMAFHTQLVNAPISIVLRLKKLFVYLAQTLNTDPENLSLIAIAPHSSRFSKFKTLLELKGSKLYSLLQLLFSAIVTR